MIIIITLIAGVVAALAILAYFYYQMNLTPTPIATPTESENVDKIDTELQNMQTDDTSETLNQTDYQGL